MPEVIVCGFCDERMDAAGRRIPMPGGMGGYEVADTTCQVCDVCQGVDLTWRRSRRVNESKGVSVETVKLADEVMRPPFSPTRRSGRYSRWPRFTDTHE